MHDIICPHCGTVFQVDESEYAGLLQQVRDTEFNKELARRLEEWEAKSRAEYTLARKEDEQAYRQELAEKDRELLTKDRELAEIRASRDKDLLELGAAKDKALAEMSASKAEELADLKAKLLSKDTETKLQEANLREAYELRLQSKEEELKYYKDFKARQSTKMIGESLEQHCLTQFNSIRMTAFPHAYFEKDNDARTGSKGDFIFRDFDDEGNEFLSIMFEMKNEMDETATKHKNEDFFRELDKDRREKGCEYAVLVSLLETDSELYNTGIVDVSYKYDKMYVIRPQFFIPLISLLRNAALHSLEYRKELQIVRNRQIDLVHFEENVDAFKAAFGRNYRLASEKFQKAIEEIDKTIDHLNKTKAALLSSETQLRYANNKAEELSIKQLTKNAPSVQAHFDAQKEARKEE